jgi:hypothetical protein
VTATGTSATNEIGTIIAVALAGAAVTATIAMTTVGVAGIETTTAETMTGAAAERAHASNTVSTPRRRSVGGPSSSQRGMTAILTVT